MLAVRVRVLVLADFSVLYALAINLEYSARTKLYIYKIVRNMLNVRPKKNLLVVKLRPFQNATIEIKQISFVTLHDVRVLLM